MIYFDTSYIVRLYVSDPGWELVQKLAATNSIACSIHGKAETIAAFHRKWREGGATKLDFHVAMKQFENECSVGVFRWLPLSSVIIERLRGAYENLPNSAALRAADALHLACAAENNFKEVYSNDARFLAAAGEFGLVGKNVI